MKKICTALLCAALFLGLGLTALAEGAGAYHLQDAGVTVTIPDGLSVVTRDTPADDPAFAALGGTRVTVVQTLIAANAYLYAFAADNAYGIQVIVQPGPDSSPSLSESQFTTRRSVSAYGRTVSIVLYSYNGPVTQAMEDTLKAVADSVKFDAPAASHLKLYVLIGGSVILAAVAAVIALTLIQSRKIGREEGEQEKAEKKKTKNWWDE